MSNTQGSARPYFRTPTISPDGAQVAFVYAGDIWLVSIEGGDAERLTASPTSHSSPRWSPDGSAIAFSSSRTGQGDIYVLPLAGGELRRVTYHDTASAVEDWSADGRQIFFSSAREQQGSEIYRVAAEGGTPILWVSQPYERINSLAVAPDGKTLAFNNSRDHWWRRGPNPYGGADIWTVGSSIGSGDFHKISPYAGMNRWPLWAPDGQGLYFVSDRDGMENLWFQPLEGTPAHQLTDFGEGRLLWPAISRDGRTIVFERDFGIWRMDVDSGAIAPLVIRVCPDTKFTPVHVATYSRDLTELELSPDGKKVAFVARGEVFADFEKLFDAKDTGHRGQGIGGKKAEEPEQQTTSDGEKPAPKIANRPEQSEAHPPSPAVEIVFGAIERHLRFLTPTQMDASAQCISPDSRDMIFRAIVAVKANLWTMPLDEPRRDQPPRQLTSGPSGKGAAQFAPDSKSFYYLDGGQIMFRKFPNGEQTQLHMSADVMIDFNQEKLQIFDECWRELRDRFYDPTFRGLDWSAARAQFAPLAAGAQTHSELYMIINLMVGELRASHLGAGGGYWSVQNGYTGLLFEPIEQATTGRLVIASIISDGPAALASDGAPIPAGDELLAVDGVELSPAINLDQLLQHTIDRRVRLRIAAKAAAPAAAQESQSAVRSPQLLCASWRSARSRPTSTMRCVTATGCTPTKPMSIASAVGGWATCIFARCRTVPTSNFCPTSTPKRMARKAWSWMYVSTAVATRPRSFSMYWPAKACC